MNKKYAILQSGFITTDTSNVVLPDLLSNQSLNVFVKLSKPIRDVSSPFSYHLPIDNLFNDYLSNPKITSKFEYREKIFLAFIDAVNTSDFLEWCSIQVNSDYYSYSHYTILNDTLSFLSGNERTLPIENWFNLIKADKEVRKMDSNLTTFKYKSKELLVVDAITTWCSQELGFRDLLFFCKLVFGKTAIRKIL